MTLQDLLLLYVTAETVKWIRKTYLAFPKGSYLHHFCIDIIQTFSHKVHRLEPIFWVFLGHCLRDVKVSVLRLICYTILKQSIQVMQLTYLVACQILIITCSTPYRNSKAVTTLWQANEQSCWQATLPLQPCTQPADSFNSSLLQPCMLQPCNFYMGHHRITPIIACQVLIGIYLQFLVSCKKSGSICF